MRTPLGINQIKSLRLPNMPRLKIDLHVHTNHSDSTSSVEKIIEVARERHLDGIAITDHETVIASAYTSRLAPDLIIIPGVEIETTEGHILVLGVKNPPTKGLNAVEVAEYARKKGGIIIIPHPNIPFLSMREEVIRQVKPDAIETHNAKTPFFWHFKEKNIRLADRLGLPKTGGSDAHSHQTVGDMYTVVDADSRTVEAVLEAVRRGKTQPEGKVSSLRERVKMSIYVLLLKLHIIRNPHLGEESW